MNKQGGPAALVLLSFLGVASIAAAIGFDSEGRAISEPARIIFFITALVFFVGLVIAVAEEARRR